MSRYSIETLNNGNILVGDTKRNGKAWWWNEAAARALGVEDVHYPDAIPIEEVRRRLFPWEAIPTPIAIKVNGEWVEVPDQIAQVTGDTHEVLGIHSAGYQGHSYNKWLLDGPAAILNEGLHIAGAGMLDNRAIAYVNIALRNSETMKSSRAGMEILPYLMATTSFNGKIATGYGFHSTIVVCDNTFDGANRQIERNKNVKYKHTSASLGRISDAQNALGIIVKGGEGLIREIDGLAAVDIASREWNLLLDKLIPTKAKDGEELSKAALTRANGKRDRLNALYNHDERVAPWKGTALGAIQAFNTFAHHESAIQKATSRVERNILDTIKGKMAENDRAVFDALNVVTDGRLRPIRVSV